MIWIFLHSVTSSTDWINFDQKSINISQSHENIFSIDISSIFTSESSLKEIKSNSFFSLNCWTRILLHLQELNNWH